MRGLTSSLLCLHLSGGRRISRITRAQFSWELTILDDLSVFQLRQIPVAN